MKTYFYKKKLSATTDEQIHEFDKRLRGFHVYNNGTVNVVIEPENSIDDESIVIPPRSSVNIGTDMLNIHYKTTSGTSTIYIYGLKHEKD